jgi:hypothetical protein
MITLLRTITVLVLVASVAAVQSCARNGPDTVNQSRGRVRTIQMQASQYFDRIANRKMSLSKFLDTASFNEVVIGDIGQTGDDEHYQQLDMAIGTKYLVELWRAIRAFERKGERNEYGRILNKLTPEFSRNADFNEFVHRNFPELLISAVVTKTIGNESELRFNSPSVIDVLYGTMDLEMRYHLWLIRPESFSHTRILVLAFFDLHDNCRAAVVLPI